MATVIAAYLDFVQGVVGATTVIVLSLVACCSVVLWARLGARAVRLSALAVAGTLTVLVALVYALAVASGWWEGAYFQTPLVVQLATLLPLSVAGWLIWLMGYGWLTEHSRHPLLIYAALALLLIVAVAVADRENISGGLVYVADDGEAWLEALLGVAVMFAPILLFEAIRRTLGRDTLP